MGRFHPERDIQRVTHFCLNFDEHDPIRDTVTFKLPYQYYHNIEEEWPLKKFLNWFHVTDEKLKELRINDLFAARSKIKCVEYRFIYNYVFISYRRNVGVDCIDLTEFWAVNL